MYIERQATGRLFSLVDNFPAVVITGARQVGKSTLVEHALGRKAEIVVFDPVVDIENARQDPELFLDNHPPPLILDEIQYAPELTASIKRRIDKDRTPGQYILSGSQQWGVIKSMAESLAGRAVFLDLDSFSLLEIAGEAENKTWLARYLEDPELFIRQKHNRIPQKRTLYEQLWRGFLPEAQFLNLEVIPDFLKAYQRTYIERDVRQMADISDLQLFGRFLRIAAALTGQEINHSQLGRELGITPQTGSRWIDILESTFQWHEIPAFSGNMIKRVSSRSKGFISDTGLACMLQAISTPKALGGTPLLGALFETAVTAELRKQASLLSPGPTFYHWRLHSGAEVDCLLEYNGIFHPMEVKIKTNPGRRDTTGLSAFRKNHPGLKIAPGLVLCAAKSSHQLTKNDYVLPWDCA